MIFDAKLANSENPKIKSQSGREKVCIIMYWCGTRKFHPRIRIFRQKLGSAEFLTNYSHPLVELPSPIPIHTKDALSPKGGVHCKYSNFSDRQVRAQLLVNVTFKFQTYYT